MRRIKRVNHYNLHLGEINIKNHSETIETFQFKKNLQIKGLNVLIGYDDILLESGESLDEQFFLHAFTNESNRASNSIAEFYNFLRFWQYMDSESIQNYKVIERINFHLEDLRDEINFSDLSGAIKLFQMNK